MSTKYFILCFLLILITLLLFLKNYEIWTYTPEAVPEKEEIKKLEKKPEALLMVEGQKNPASIQSYISISEKNIFNPERKEFPILGGNAKKPLVRPQIVLYGVTIAGNYQSASVANPGRPLKKGERELMTVKVGDQVGEYKLAKIMSDRITMEAEGDTFEVLLYDPRMPKRRMDVKTETKPAAITSTQPLPATRAAGTPPPTPSTASPVTASPPTSVEAPKPTPPGEQVGTPPLPLPARPTFPSPEMRRGRRPVYTPPQSSTPTQDTGGN